MDSYKNKLLAGILLCATVFSGNTSASLLYGTLAIDEGIKAPVEVAPGTFVDLYQSGSYFVLGDTDPNSNSAAMLVPGSAGGIQLGLFQNFVTDPDEPHPEGHPDAVNGAGSGYNGLTSQSSVLEPFLFFGIPTYVGTNPVSYQSAAVKEAPTMDLGPCSNNICTISVDLGAWEVYWNGSVFEQGPRPDNTQPFSLASGSIDVVSGRYSLNWASQILNGPFNGVIGFWHLEGTLLNPTSVAPVPIPAAVWLFITGLFTIAGFSNRKSKSARS